MILFILILDINECETLEGIPCTCHESFIDCDGICINVDGSYECGCPQGLLLDEDEITCIGEYAATSTAEYLSP